MTADNVNVIRTSDDDRVDWTPCCHVEFRGDIVHGEECPACGEIMLWCRGCGSGDGSDFNTCDLCNREICADCEADRDDDAPIDLCSDCCG